MPMAPIEVLRERRILCNLKPKPTKKGSVCIGSDERADRSKQLSSMDEVKTNSQSCFRKTDETLQQYTLERP